MPYWADIDIRRTGHIFYSQSTTDVGALEKARREVADAFPNMATVKPTWLMVVTWYNVTHYPDNCEECAYKRRNTFQAVLTTDGRHSFAIFLYHNITWTTGTESGGSRYDGLGGTAAQVGFDLGDGNPAHYTMTPSSCTADVQHIDEQSNVAGADNVGRWVFRVDGAAIQTAGCTEQQWQARQLLRVQPNVVPDLVPTSIELIGPCLENQNGVEAKCRFYDFNGNTTTTKASIVADSPNNSMGSNTRFVCWTPIFYTIGRLHVQLEISVNNTADRVYDGYLYTIVDQHNNDDDDDRPQAIFYQDGDDMLLNLTWTPDAISNTTRSHVDIGLVGLPAGRNSNSTPAVMSLLSDAPNSGHAVVNMTQLLEQYQHNREQHEQFAKQMAQLIASRVLLIIVPKIRDTVDEPSETVDRLKRSLPISPFSRRSWDCNLVERTNECKKWTYAELSGKRTNVISSIKSHHRMDSSNKATSKLSESDKIKCLEWYLDDPGTQDLNLTDCPPTVWQARADSDNWADSSSGLS